MRGRADRIMSIWNWGIQVETLAIPESVLQIFKNNNDR